MSELFDGDTLEIEVRLVDPDTESAITGAAVAVDFEGPLPASSVSVSEVSDGVFRGTLEATAAGLYLFTSTATKNTRSDVQKTYAVVGEKRGGSEQQTLGISSGVQHELIIRQAPLNADLGAVSTFSVDDSSDPAIAVDASASQGNTPLEYEIDWDDGTTEGPKLSATFSHTYSDDGDYNVAVTVTDGDGDTDTAYAIVNVRGTIDAATGVSATAGSEEVTVGWTSSSDTDIATETVYYSTSTFSDVSNATAGPSVASPAASSSQSETVTGLSAGTEYHFRIESVDPEGNTVLSSEVTATPAVAATYYVSNA